MTSFVVKFEDLGIESATKDMIVRFPDIAGRALYTSAIAIVVPEMRKVIKENNTIFRGELFQRIGARVTIKPSGPELDIGAFAVPYSAAVDQGTGPREIDSAEATKILDWVAKKILKEGSIREVLSSSGKTIRRRKKLTMADGTAAIRIASLIIKQIRKKGSIAHPFILPAWETTKILFVNDAIARMRARLGT